MKSGFVAIAGRPNVGKSTLVNALCGGKVAIVSDKPQTTRRRIFGIANADDYQLVLADLPGFQRPRDALTERMQHTVDASFEDVDGVVLVLSARERIGAGDRFIASRVFSLGVPVVIALNKVDRLKPGHIAQQMNAAARLGDFNALHPVSAKTHDGIPRAARGARRAPARGARSTSRASSGPISRSRRRSASSIREKALWLTRDEVPHAISVEVDEMTEKVVRAFVLVETESQKQILVGKGGAMVRDIGTRARPEIEALLGHTSSSSSSSRSARAGAATKRSSTGSACRSVALSGRYHVPASAQGAAFRRPVPGTPAFRLRDRHAAQVGRRGRRAMS